MASVGFQNMVYITKEDLSSIDYRHWTHVLGCDQFSVFNHINGIFMRDGCIRDRIFECPPDTLISSNFITNTLLHYAVLMKYYIHKSIIIERCHILSYITILT